MKEHKIISRLSELPIGELTDLSLLVSMASQFSGGLSKTPEKWAVRIHKALLEKQVDYFTAFEDLDNNPIGI